MIKKNTDKKKIQPKIIKSGGTGWNWRNTVLELDMESTVWPVHEGSLDTGLDQLGKDLNIPAQSLLPCMVRFLVDVILSVVCRGDPLVAQSVKNLPADQETSVWSLGQEDPLEKRMAPHSSILAWRIPWTEEPGGLQSLGQQRVRHNWATITFTLMMRHESWLQDALSLGRILKFLTQKPL